MKNKKKSRRSFLRKATLSSAIITSSPILLANKYRQEVKIAPRTVTSEKFKANDQIHLALIGSGIQGIYDTNSALNVDGVKLVAACDLYTGRLERAKELWGKDISVTRDYREILENKERPSSKYEGKIKKYKALTEKGLEFGINKENPSSPGQTTPHYYVEKFDELFFLIKENS